MFSASILLIFYLCLSDDGKVYKKNPRWRTKYDRPRREKKYIHVATFKPEKRFGGIVKNYVKVLFTFNSEKDT